MPDDRRPTGILNADADAIARGYESRDLKIAPTIFIFGATAILFAALCGGVWWLYRFEIARPVAGSGPLSAVERRTLTSDAPPLQPQPGHESLDTWDLQKMREHEESTFAAIGWAVDPKTHRVAVPAALVDALRTKQAATRPATSPAEGGR